MQPVSETDSAIAAHMSMAAIACALKIDLEDHTMPFDLNTLAGPCDGPETCQSRMGITCIHYPVTQGHLDNDAGRNLLITAVEGGINYWATTSGYRPDAGTVTVHDEYDGETYTVTAEDMIDAARYAILHYPKTRAAEQLRHDAAGADAEAADVVMQVATLGRITYG